ncbi:9758_t:CDS:2, partial [Gigaspora rosea]
RSNHDFSKNNNGILQEGIYVYKKQKDKIANSNKKNEGNSINKTGLSKLNIMGPTTTIDTIYYEEGNQDGMKNYKNKLRTISKRWSGKQDSTQTYTCKASKGK